MPDRTCFVIMGFGEKTDYPTGRMLNLDKTYEHLIRPAVEQAGLKCVRADEILHSGVIDGPMYESLREADLVIADLSTSNVNAFYELGVRHALRKAATIVIAEEKMFLPFDTNHVATQRYRHLGPDIGASDVQTFVPRLKQLIVEVVARGRTDSPVYTFLHALEEPRPSEGRVSVPIPVDPNAQTLATLRAQVQSARKNSDFPTAKAFLRLLREVAPNDRDVVHQLALVTYKELEPKSSGEPPPPGYREALLQSRQILEPLEPLRTNDPETLGIWGAVHKRLWDSTRERAHLDEAILAYEKGFYLKRDYYNGINHAFMLNERAAVQADPNEAIADIVVANRHRRAVLVICDEILHGNIADPWIAMRTEEEASYWLAATIWEAYVGLGDETSAERWRERLEQLPAGDWMRASTKRQVEALRRLLKQA